MQCRKQTLELKYVIFEKQNCYDNYLKTPKFLKAFTNDYGLHSSQLFKTMRAPVGVRLMNSQQLKPELNFLSFDPRKIKIESISKIK